MSDQVRLLTPNPAWFSELKYHAGEHKLAASGLVLALIAVLILLTQSIVHLSNAPSSENLKLALLGGTAGFIATTVGALPALFLRSLPQAMEDSLLGIAAGMMLAASAFSLLLPGIEAGTELFQSDTLGALIVVLGMSLGVLLMLGLDAFTPHEHDKTGPCGPGYQACDRIWLFVFAIALHNLPEGMAVGVSFANGDMSVGLPLATAIALQDIPEGLAVALSLRAAGFKAGVAVFVAGASGVLEPLGALIGVGLSSGFAAAYPMGLGLAAGAMIFVVSHEVIPETHRNGHQTAATLGLMVGFAVMMVLDTTLG
jgi:ZIP family zinc transporter